MLSHLEITSQRHPERTFSQIPSYLVKYLVKAICRINHHGYSEWLYEKPNVGGKYVSRKPSHGYCIIQVSDHGSLTGILVVEVVKSDGILYLL